MKSPPFSINHEDYHLDLKMNIGQEESVFIFCLDMMKHPPPTHTEARIIVHLDHDRLEANHDRATLRS